MYDELRTFTFLDESSFAVNIINESSIQYLLLACIDWCNIQINSFKSTKRLPTLHTYYR